MLLDGNANPNVEDSTGARPIHSAAALGHSEVVRLLIDNGADINVAENHYGLDPLMLATDLGREAVVQLLLERGANRKYEDPEHRASALHLAAKAGHAQIARALINAGWAVIAVNKYGHTPLITAAFKGHDACLQLLLDCGGDMDLLAIGGGNSTPFRSGAKSCKIREVAHQPWRRCTCWRCQGSYGAPRCRVCGSYQGSKGFA